MQCKIKHHEEQLNEQMQQITALNQMVDGSRATTKEMNARTEAMVMTVVEQQIGRLMDKLTVLEAQKPTIVMKEKLHDAIIKKQSSWNDTATVTSATKPSEGAATESTDNESGAASDDSGTAEMESHTHEHPNGVGDDSFNDNGNDGPHIMETKAMQWPMSLMDGLDGISQKLEADGSNTDVTDTETSSRDSDNNSNISNGSEGDEGSVSRGSTDGSSGCDSSHRHEIQTTAKHIIKRNEWEHSTRGLANKHWMKIQRHITATANGRTDQITTRLEKLTTIMTGQSVDDQVVTAYTKVFNDYMQSTGMMMWQKQMNERFLPSSWRLLRAMIFVINHNGHWLVGVARMKEREVQMIDSGRNPRPLEVLNDAQQFMEAITGEKWNKAYSNIHQVQPSMNDSGVCAIATAFHLAFRTRKIVFMAGTMVMTRKQILWSIYSKSLVELSAAGNGAVIGDHQDIHKSNARYRVMKVTAQCNEVKHGYSNSPAKMTAPKHIVQHLNSDIGEYIQKHPPDAPVQT
jgi:hypothetical protein